VHAVFVKDPPLWSLNIMNGTHMWFDDIVNNATAVNAPFGQNWVQNTDGFDTMDAYNIMLTNLYYQGGDDCIAIKPRSYNIYAQNVSRRMVNSSQLTRSRSPVMEGMELPLAASASISRILRLSM
jgi:polygalacturonase